MVKTAGDFKKKMDICKSYTNVTEKFTCQDKVRGEYRSELSGRLSNMGDEVHKFMSKLDKQHLNAYKHKSLKEVANEFGVVEDMRHNF